MDVLVSIVTAAMKVDSIPPVQYLLHTDFGDPYQSAIIKSVVRINDTFQQEIVYTYNRHGQLVESVTRKHEIGIA